MVSLTENLNTIVNLIPADFGGGSPLSKTYLMSYLFLKHNLNTYVEIGIYKGRSLFPVTYAVKHNNGMAYGIDPYCQEAAREYDVEENLQKKIDNFINELDFEKIYQDVESMRSQLNFQNNLQIIRKTSSEAIEFFKNQNITIDMLHIDGNHDTKYVMQDIELYFPLINPDGFIIMDDINWDSVKPAYNLIKEKMNVVFEDKYFAILSNSKKEHCLDLPCIFSLNENLIKLNQTITQQENIIESSKKVINNKIGIITEQERIIEEKDTEIASLQKKVSSFEQCIWGKLHKKFRKQVS